MLKFLFKILNFVKKVVRRVIQSPGLVMDKYQYRERFSHRKIKISHRRLNHPIEYKQFNLRNFPHGENYRTVKNINLTVRKISAN
jgi:hypothetical protein